MRGAVTSINRRLLRLYGEDSNARRILVHVVPAKKLRQPLVQQLVSVGCEQQQLPDGVLGGVAGRGGATASLVLHLGISVQVGSRSTMSTVAKPASSTLRR